MHWSVFYVHCVRQGSAFSFITHKVHSILSQPVKALKEQEEGKEGDEARREIIPEHSESQARLGHSVPRAFDEMLGVARKECSNGYEQKSLSSIIKTVQ